MNKFYNKLERKLGRYAVPNLTYIIIGCYVMGYLLTALNSEVTSFMTLEPAMILKGQVWRLLTWLVIPPGDLSIFTIIMLFFYLSIGRSLEQAWGTFCYNLYIFGGLIITLLAAFVTFGVFSIIFGRPVMFGAGGMSPFSTYYICMSMFLGFAATFPDAQVLLYFVIPVKVKWLGYLYAAFLVYDGVGYVRGILNGYVSGWVYLIAMVASLLNFIVFFMMTRDFRRFSYSEQKRKRDFKRSMAAGQKIHYEATAKKSDGVTPRHRCSVCGITDISDPDMDFRFCSKCQGSHEYCREHLFTHIHVQ